jgi:hypothetical protein
MKQKISYIVEVNGRVVKSGTDRIDFKKMREFEQKLVKQYKVNTDDVVEILFR